MHQPLHWTPFHVKVYYHFSAELSHIFLFPEKTFPLGPMVVCNDSTGFDFIVVWFDRYCPPPCGLVPLRDDSYSPAPLRQLRSGGDGGGGGGGGVVAAEAAVVGAATAIRTEILYHRRRRWWRRRRRRWGR